MGKWAGLLILGMTVIWYFACCIYVLDLNLGYGFPGGLLRWLPRYLVARCVYLIYIVHLANQHYKQRG